MMPVEKNLTCYKGQTYEQDFYFTKNKQVIDLTGITVRSQIRPSENNQMLTAEFDVTVYPAEGKVTLALSDAVTSVIRDGAYWWDMKAVDGSDKVKYWVRGKFLVSGRVTE